MEIEKTEKLRKFKIKRKITINNFFFCFIEASETILIQIFDLGRNSLRKFQNGKEKRRLTQIVVAFLNEMKVKSLTCNFYLSVLSIHTNGAIIS